MLTMEVRGNGYRTVEDMETQITTKENIVRGWAQMRAQYSSIANVTFGFSTKYSDKPQFR